MDFSDRIMALATRVQELRPHATTEETTKAALINPFLQALGYDTSDPRVVIMEYTADIGTKKGEKIDYAIKRDGDIIFCIEAKCCTAQLDAGKAGQLHRYFHNLATARIGILTNGVRYEFYSDLDKPNVMDEKPFMIFDFDQVEESLIPELKKLANDVFNVDVALCAAQELKHMRQIRQLIAAEVRHPSDDMVRLFAAQVTTSPLRAPLIESFRPMVKAAFEKYINGVLLERIQGVADMSGPSSVPVESRPEKAESAHPDGEEDGKAGIMTTQEEVEGYLIVKAILREIVDPSRVTMRDRQTYCGVLLDDNGRKPICRLHFNSANVKYLGTFDAEKNETKNKIDSLNDLYKYAEQIKAVVEGYLQGS